MSKSAFHHYKQAEKMLRNGDFKTGKDLLIKTLDIDSDFYSALYRLSEIDKKLFSNIYLNKMASLDSGFSYSSPKKPSKKKDRKSTRLNSSHSQQSRMPSSA